MAAGRPAHGHDVVDLVEQLVDAGAGQSHDAGRLANAGDRTGNSQPVLGQAGDLLCGVDADLLQQRTDEVLEDLRLAGDAGRLEHPADPLLDLIDQPGTMRTTRWSCVPISATRVWTLWKTSRIARTRFSPCVFMVRISPSVYWV